MTRLSGLKQQFNTIFNAETQVVVNSPGRAEIIGNHTDYNLGYALGCAISQSTLGLFAPSKDGEIIFRTTNARLRGDHYCQAVAAELKALNYPLTGARILVDTNFPTSGGLSSSAALELCLAYGLLTLAGQNINPEIIAPACQRAENGPLVNSPCGFLDQGVIAFAQKDRLVLLDFQPPVKHRLVKAELPGCSLVVAADKSVKRILGDSGYPARRRSCEAAAKVLGIKSLREISIADFEARKGQLEPISRRRAEHIVYENQRVLDTVNALNNRDLIQFGQLLNRSGQSALTLYALAENTPELTDLMNTAQKLDGVLGARNMGGGFSAIILALVKNEFLAKFSLDLQAQYSRKFLGQLEFIRFTPSEGVTILA
jgi:galactokinase